LAPKKDPKPASSEEDYYKSFRSYVVLVWMFCNAALVAIVLRAGGLSRLSVQTQPSGGGDPSVNVNIYLQVILWSVAGLSAFKFVGAMWYRIIRFVSNEIQYWYGLLLT
jgi:chitin synthase